MWSHSSNDQEARKGIFGERKSSKRGDGRTAMGEGRVRTNHGTFVCKSHKPISLHASQKLITKQTTLQTKQHKGEKQVILFLV